MALGVPKSSEWLRGRAEKMLPKIDLPDLLFEVHSWTGHVSPRVTDESTSIRGGEVEGVGASVKSDRRLGER